MRLPAASCVARDTLPRPMRYFGCLLFILFTSAFAEEVPVQLEPFLAKGAVVPRSYPYNSFLELAAFHQKYAASGLHFEGYGFTKSPQSTYPQPLRVFVEKPRGQTKEITNTEAVYAPVPELKGARLWTNQPVGTVRAHAVLSLPADWRDKEWNAKTLTTLVKDFSLMIRKCNLGARRNPVRMLTDKLKGPFPEADELIIEGSDPVALESLQRQTGGVLKTGSLRLSLADIAKLPKAWRLETGRIDRLYPWRAGTPPAHSDRPGRVWYPLMFSAGLSSAIGGLLSTSRDDLSKLNLRAQYTFDDWAEIWQ